MGMVQLTFLSANTYYISKADYMMAIITAFATNIMFSYSVSKLAFSNWFDRIVFSTGCCAGCTIGIWLAKILG